MKPLIIQFSLIVGLLGGLIFEGNLRAQQIEKSRNPLVEFANNQRNENQPSDAGIRVTISGKLALCSHTERGHIILDVQGGVAPYKFLWNNNQTVQNRENLFAGTYTVIITDSQGSSVTEKIIIQPPLPFIVRLDEKIDATCATGNVGSAKINIVFGRGEPYKINWSHGLEDSLEAKNLRPGDYHVTITDLFNCDMTIAFNIEGDANGIKVNEMVEQPSCQNGLKGAISLDISGGKAPYSILWSNGSTSKNLSDLDPGNYLVVIKDANGCAYQQEFEMKAVDALEINTLAVVDNLCAGSESGEIEVAITGGKAPYQVKWSNGQNTTAIRNLSAGIFTLEVVDAEGCKATKSFEIKAPQALTVNLSSFVEMNCETGRAIGYASVDIMGGTHPYTINWSNGVTALKEVTVTQSEDLSVQITDANGCTITGRIKVDLPYYGELGRVDFEYRKLEITSNDEVFVSEPLQFTSFIAPEFIAWEWNFGDGNTSNERNPVHVYKEAGRFEVILKAFDSYGCFSTQMHEVMVIKANEWLTIPGAFTPNGDGLNDFFKPVVQGESKFEMRIFNNWGEELFATSQKESGWDGTFRGKLLPRGNYMYRISMTTLTGEVIQRAGSFTLIR